MYRLDERIRAIGEMFSDIAPRYDFLNRRLSLGVDRRWRREAVSEMVPPAGGRHLDMATGTADVALDILRQRGTPATLRFFEVHEAADIEHSDVCRELLDALPEAERAEAHAAACELAEALRGYLTGMQREVGLH